jgi:translation initiation factor IF-3
MEVLVITKKDLLINDEINAEQVRVIDENGNSLGIMTPDEALKIAEGKDLDLVEIAPMAKPPVWKIIDYKKYIFDLAKKEKDAKKNQKIVDTKEIKLGLGIGDHDFDVKVKSAEKFLKNGDEVKVTLKFVGREMNFTKLGEELIQRFVESVKECGSPKNKSKLEGRRMTITICPNK